MAELSGRTMLDWLLAYLSSSVCDCEEADGIRSRPIVSGLVEFSNLAASPSESATTLLPGQDKPAPSAPTSAAPSFVVSCGVRLSEVNLPEIRKPQVSRYLYPHTVLRRPETVSFIPLLQLFIWSLELVKEVARQTHCLLDQFSRTVRDALRS